MQYIHGQFYIPRSTARQHVLRVKWLQREVDTRTKERHEEDTRTEVPATTIYPLKTRHPIHTTNKAVNTNRVWSSLVMLFKSVNPLCMFLVVSM